MFLIQIINQMFMNLISVKWKLKVLILYLRLIEEKCMFLLLMSGSQSMLVIL